LYGAPSRATIARARFARVSGRDTGGPDFLPTADCEPPTANRQLPTANRQLRLDVVSQITEGATLASLTFSNMMRTVRGARPPAAFTLKVRQLMLPLAKSRHRTVVA
jgi:hypothetical protein